MSAMQVQNLLITAFGRDLLTLLGLAIVMVVHDPILSVFALVIAPPALLFIRKLVRRTRGIAQGQFTGGMQILETMQEATQGIRIVKAFGLEDTMRARMDANVGEIERQSNKMARVASRSQPLIETLAGFAVPCAIPSGGSRVIEAGAAARGGVS